MQQTASNYLHIFSNPSRYSLQARVITHALWSVSTGKACRICWRMAAAQVPQGKLPLYPVLCNFALKRLVRAWQLAQWGVLTAGDVDSLPFRPRVNSKTILDMSQHEYSAMSSIFLRMLPCRCLHSRAGANVLDDLRLKQGCTQVQGHKGRSCNTDGV